MGKIISSKRSGSEILFEVEVGPEEATILNGHYDDVHLFTERVANIDANISSRGKNSATKYFLIPRQLRKNLDYFQPVGCQKIETGDKVIFIYVVDKDGKRVTT
ncbi:hypothetical protein JXA48_02915 [Candidatus Woesearchaeota archaeon]|nr:hypothetical protein [Candidatus Woesearchaeota archaeon]